MLDSQETIVSKTIFKLVFYSFDFAFGGELLRNKRRKGGVLLQYYLVVSSECPLSVVWSAAGKLKMAQQM